MPRRPPRLGAAPRERGSTTRHQALYNLSRWRRASAAFRRSLEGCLCIDCKARGLIVPSEVTDHIVPHNGDLRLFWDRSNWAARCWSCHSSKSRADASGKSHRLKGCTATGTPADPQHHWHSEPS